MKPLTDNPSATAKMHETENDVSENRRLELNTLTNQRLGDVMSFRRQIKQAHRNVQRPLFIGLHEQLDKIDEVLESYVDLIADHIVQLGGILCSGWRCSACCLLASSHFHCPGFLALPP
jgi:hypothetical protein